MQPNGTSARGPPRLAMRSSSIEAIESRCIGSIEHQTPYQKGNENENLVYQQ